MEGRMSPTETKVLEALVEADDYSGYCYLAFDALCANTGLERKVVRRACRSLARKGLAQFGKGLWTEDGEMAGSGYCATKAAPAALASA